MTNLSDTDAYYTGALHTYFAVSTPKAVQIPALEQATFYDKLTEKLCEPQLFKNGIGPVDRIYHTDKVMRIIDNHWQRVIELKARNTQQWVFGIQESNSQIIWLISTLMVNKSLYV